MTETLIPSSQEEWLAWRARDLTSSDIAGLFGCSPYVTEFELWHRKAEGRGGAIEETERMKWGQRLQAAIAAGIAEEQGWKVRHMPEYLRLPDLRLGASFDFSIEERRLDAGGSFGELKVGNVTGNPLLVDYHGVGLLEVKNVDALQYRDGWLVDGDTVEAPPHIELQIQLQLLVSGRAFAYLGALIGGNRVVLQSRDPNSAIHAAIRQKAAAFWASVDAGTPPQPDFTQDAETIARLHGYAEPGKVIEADERIAELSDHYRQAQNACKIAQKDRRSAKAQLLTLIGDAERVRGEGFTISAGVIGPQHISYDRAGYRDFRVFWKKIAKEEA